MNTKFIVKVNVLVFALIAVIFLMSKLRKGGLNDDVTAALALNGTRTTLDWCDTRVSALERPEKPTLRQVGSRWTWEETPVKDLNYLAVEKWFAENCKRAIERLAPTAFNEAEAKPALIVNFVKGPAETLFVTAAGIYRWRREIFKSEEMTKALSDLEALPDWGARTSH